ncbi:MAG: xylulokinase [Ahrensia sp.]|nr:xylulokinase [Ahrensia sp.]
MSFLGIDLGTSGLRALLVDKNGTPIGSAERSYEVSNPRPGWSEQNPADWIDALEAAVFELRSQFPAFCDLCGIGVAGHMHGATLIDASGNVLRPCILWNDVRSEKEAHRLDGIDHVRELSGNIVFPGFTAPKLAWVREHEPELFAKIHKVLLPAAFLNNYLTGEYVADMSDSAGTSWLNVAHRLWSNYLLDVGQMREDQMPRLVEGSECAGMLRSELSRKWGLSHGVAVAGGAGDNAAAACGIGALNEGAGFVSLGTSGVILVARNSYAAAPDAAVHTFCHAVPNHWYQMGVMLSATDSLNWLSKITGKRPAELTRALGENIRPPATVRFLPYLSGERTPHNDSQIRGGFTGLSTATSTEDLTCAVLEGVAFGLRDSFEALGSTGVEIESLMAIGGGSASTYWLKLIATTLNIPLRLPAGREFGAALGAARLAMTASTKSTLSEVMIAPRISESITPNEDHRAALEEAYESFKNAYPGLRRIQ